MLSVFYLPLVSVFYSHCQTILETSFSSSPCCHSKMAFYQKVCQILVNTNFTEIVAAFTRSFFVSIKVNIL